MTGLQKTYKHVHSIDELNTAAGEGWRFVAVVHSGHHYGELSVVYLVEREAWEK